MKKLLFILPLLILISCEETEESDIDLGDYHLFTATFEEGELDDNATSFIFISDNEGNVLADSSFIGAASFELFADTSLSPPTGKIGVTILTKHDGEYFDIQTNLGIDRGSEWTWHNPHYEPEVIGQSYYTFINLPDDLIRVIISSNGHYERTSNINNDDTYEVSHYENLEDVLIMGLLNDGTAIYKFVQDVSAGETHSIDFNGFSVTNQIIMNNNTDLNYDYSILYGYESNDSFISYKRHRLNHGDFGEGVSWDSNQNFIFNYPPEFGKFRTSAYVGDDWGTAGGKNWYQSTVGEIPTTFEKYDVDISVITSEINNFEVNLTGTCDQWSMNLSNSEISGDWVVYINPSINNGKLPLFPISISNEYPELLREDFIMNRVVVTDWLCAENQEEWHNLYFNTAGYYLDFCSGYRNLIHWLD